MSNKITINIPTGSDYEINLIGKADVKQDAAAVQPAEKKKNRVRKHKPNTAIGADKELANYLIHNGYIGEMRGMNKGVDEHTPTYFFAKSDDLLKAVEAYKVGFDQMQKAKASETEAAEVPVDPVLVEDEFAEFNDVVEDEAPPKKSRKKAPKVDAE